jgi:hypothetical protein
LRHAELSAFAAIPISSNQLELCAVGTQLAPVSYQENRMSAANKSSELLDKASTGSSFKTEVIVCLTLDCE